MHKPTSFGFVINPHAGRRKSEVWQREIRETMAAAAVGCEIIETHDIERVEDHVRGLMERHEAVIGVGGDGTAHTVAQPLVGSRTPFGLLPNGSGNDFSRMLEMPKGVGKGLEMLLRGYSIRSRNVMQVVATLADSSTAIKRWSINTTGFGFDAAVSRTKTRIPVLKGILLYLTSSLVTLAQFKASTLMVEHRYGERYSGLMVAAGVGKFEGGGFKVFPDASAFGDTFELCEVLEGNALKALPLLVRAVGGGHTTSPKVRMSKQTAVVLRSDRPIPVHADGEVLSEEVVELRIDLVPNGLLTIFPGNPFVA